MKWIVLILMIVIVAGDIASAVNVSSCTNISAAGTYTMINSITNDANTSCITINVSDVRFNGSDYIIDGVDTASTVGINISSPPATVLENITINNVTMTDWYNAIGIYGTLNNNTYNVTMENITATSNANAVYYNYTNDTQFINSNASENTLDAFYFNIDTWGNSIAGCEVFNNSLSGLFTSDESFFNWGIGNDISTPTGYDYKMESTDYPTFTYVYNPASRTSSFGVV